MTNEEAIKELSERYEIGKKEYMDNIPEYVEALRMGIEALKRAVPMKVYHFKDSDTFETTCCGIDVTSEDFKFCPECGQLLGEVEEVEEHEDY